MGENVTGERSEGGEKGKKASWMEGEGRRGGEQVDSGE